jgi:MoaA/NifB/PqqE/SkfB family radical SAM enzyme
MPFERYEKIARKLFPSALRVSICSGGEPLLYGHIRDALKLARSYDTVTSMTSNGMLLDQNVSDWLVEDQSLFRLVLSFDGARQDTLEKIRRGANYHTILENVRYLTAVKKRKNKTYPLIKIRYVLMRANVEEFPEIFEIAARHGIGEVEVQYLNAPTDSLFEESLFNNQYLSREACRKARSKSKEFGVKLYFPSQIVSTRRVKRCFYPWQFCQIDTDGSIRFCYHSWPQRLGFFDDDFEKVWNGESYCRIRKSVDSSDPYYPYCRYCATRLGEGVEEAHNQTLHYESYYIPGLDHLQIPFNERQQENVNSFKELRNKSLGQAEAT